MRNILLCIVVFSLIGAPVCIAADIVIVIHGATKVTSIDKKMIQDIFTGKKTVWDDNTRITFATLQQGPIHEQFMRKIVERTPSQFTNFWKQQVFLGKATKMPMVCRSMEEMVEYISGTPGSIGYVASEKDVSGANIKEIIIVQ